MSSIYLAASHRNEFMSDVYIALRQAGHTVYSPHESGFTWPVGALKPMPDAKYLLYKEPRVVEAVNNNLQMLINADIVVGVEPLGIDAAMMLGYACSFKPDNTYLLLQRGSRVLACALCYKLCTTLEKLLDAISG
jgi:hypothetical protein